MIDFKPDNPPNRLFPLHRAFFLLSYHFTTQSFPQTNTAITPHRPFRSSHNSFFAAPPTLRSPSSQTTRELQQPRDGCRGRCLPFTPQHAQTLQRAAHDRHEDLVRIQQLRSHTPPYTPPGDAGTGPATAARTTPPLCTSTHHTTLTNLVSC